jgi:hypothetical protein
LWHSAASPQIDSKQKSVLLCKIVSLRFQFIDTGERRATVYQKVQRSDPGCTERLRPFGIPGFASTPSVWDMERSVAVE